MILRTLIRRGTQQRLQLGMEQSSRRTLATNKFDPTTCPIATPLPFNPKANNPSLALLLKGTASVLNPKCVYLSPCFGAALTTSPLVGSLLRASPFVSSSSSSSSSSFSPLHNAARLADQLFFRMIRESSIFVTRTKSMPAAYLTPTLIGTILGESLFALGRGSNDCNPTQRQEENIRSYLQQQHGIRSNKIYEQWTGVSLSRWIELFRLTSNSSSSSNNNEPTQWMAVALWLTALWETAETKVDWLDYLIECDRRMRFHNNNNQSLFRTDDLFAQALADKDPLAVIEWQENAFTEQELNSTSNIQEALDLLCFYFSSQDTERGEMSNWSEISSAIELVCCATAMKQIPALGQKPVVPNGYYGFDGGDAKAGKSSNCVQGFVSTCRSNIALKIWIHPLRLC